MAAVTAPELTLLTGEGDDMEAPGRAHPAWRGLEAEQGEVLTHDVSTYAARVGERLRAVRNLAGLSQEDVVAAAGGEFTAEALSTWEHGAREISAPSPASTGSPSGHCCPTSPTATPSCAGTPPGPRPHTPTSASPGSSRPTVPP